MPEMTYAKSGKFPLQILVRVAVLVALDVLLMNYLGIHTQFFKIGFSFVPVAVCGMLYGPKWGTACAGLGDLINCLLGPYGWFPPLTVSACLTGLLYGLLLKNRTDNLKMIILTVGIIQVFVSLLFTTFCLTLLYGTPYPELLVSRLPQVVLMFPVQVIVLRALGNARIMAALGGNTLQSA